MTNWFSANVSHDESVILFLSLCYPQKSTQHSSKENTEWRKWCEWSYEKVFKL